MMANLFRDAHKSNMEHVRAVFARSTFALTLVDAQQADMPVILCNQAFVDLTGFPEHEVLGRNCRFLQDDLPNHGARALARDCLSNGRRGRIVFQNRRKSGEVFNNQVFLEALVDQAGTPAYFIGAQFLFVVDDMPRSPRSDSPRRGIHAADDPGMRISAQVRTEHRQMLVSAAHAVANAWLMAQ